MNELDNEVLAWIIERERPAYQAERARLEEEARVAAERAAEAKRLAAGRAARIAARLAAPGVTEVEAGGVKWWLAPGAAMSPSDRAWAVQVVEGLIARRENGGGIESAEVEQLARLVVTEAYVSGDYVDGWASWFESARPVGVLMQPTPEHLRWRDAHRALVFLPIYMRAAFARTEVRV